MPAAAPVRLAVTIYPMPVLFAAESAVEDRICMGRAARRHRPELRHRPPSQAAFAEHVSEDEGG